MYIEDPNLFLANIKVLFELVVRARKPWSGINADLL